jgi:adenylate cyclase
MDNFVLWRWLYLPTHRTAAHQDRTVMFELAANELRVASDNWRWGRETRSGWLRLAVLAILIVMLSFGETGANELLHISVVGSYALTSLLALGLALAKRGPRWISPGFVIADALLVLALFYEHLLTDATAHEQALTAVNLAVAFLLLNHVSLRLKPQLVLLFATVVLIGWFVLVTAATFLHGSGKESYHLPRGFVAESVVTATFAFAAFVVYLLTRDHNVLLASATKSERRRQNLSRFFSPRVVSELETRGSSLDLERRNVAVMFVDLRCFTRFSETADPNSLARLLGEYRRIVADTVFSRGGTIDKFIGDGVMAVFGHPKASPEDASQALACALELKSRLEAWNKERRERGEPVLDAGIGLHFGAVIAGLLESGRHSEFTVFGDAVNVAERLERLTKQLDAHIVVSKDLLDEIRPPTSLENWQWQDAAELPGRSGMISVAYLLRHTDV